MALKQMLSSIGSLNLDLIPAPIVCTLTEAKAPRLVHSVSPVFLLCSSASSSLLYSNSSVTLALILFLNGGPGCSSLLGALAENGPYRLQTDGKTLKENDIGTWNLDANLVRSFYRFYNVQD